jgi:hypothetical protein
MTFAPESQATHMERSQYAKQSPQADPEHLSALAVFDRFVSSLPANRVIPRVTVGYVIVAPLDANDRIDARLWRAHREACRIARLRPSQDDALGHLAHRQGGGWAFHYDADAEVPDEVGVHLADERFVPSEYVSIKEAGKTHTYCVMAVSHL